MSKLQILIPQYNEDDAAIKPMLDSIEMQQYVDFKNDFEVLIGNDGSDTKLSIDFLKKYTFKIQYHYFEHGRLAATRQKLLNLATADYIMFCDADDMFMNNCAISVILGHIKKGADMLIYDFYCNYELKDGVHYHLYHDDPIFVHGKVFRRQFLVDEEIKWHPELHEHQDSAFNILARTCAKNAALCSIPIYLWRNNPKSISRKDPIMHLPKTWPHMIDSYDALVGDLQARGLSDYAAYYAKYCLYATYYEMSRDAWQPETSTEYRNASYKRLAQFYFKYKLLIKTVNTELTEKLIKTTYEITSKKGKLNEMPQFKEWLNSILTLYKGA